ncbi:phospholipase D family protein [Oricola nitratireducens]|uniref:phospholipase D family protein n=1 Tax=Oricola nitratireducens TaxID=2775868 RepID=UPI00186714A0|nr:phospholipase D family protein [Oricola nitratireducens]
MLSDGERIKRLIGSARKEVLLCAPFIKHDVLEKLLELVAPRVRVTVVTRWKAAEVAAGVSDLSVFELMTEKENTQLLLLDELHAKLYVADDACLVGSANLTGKALGWSPNPNIEILVDLKRSDEQVQALLERLAHAYEATFALRNEIQKEADALEELSLPEAEKVDPENTAAQTSFWLPRCAAPDRLYDVYRKLSTGAGIFSSTEQDAKADVEALAVPSGLDEPQFVSHVAGAISSLPGMMTVLEGVPGTIDDEEGIRLVGEMYPNYDAGERRKQWEIVREWIRVVLADRFEVAPSNYVVRLKPKQN